MALEQRLTDYEQFRQENVIRNNEKLIELGLKSRNQVTNKLTIKKRRNSLNKDPCSGGPRRSSRPKKQIAFDLSNTYGAAPEDHFLCSFNNMSIIYTDCEDCNDYFINGCLAHPLLIMDGSNLVCVSKSRIENAGRGVFNVSKQTFEKNTLFGPYLGSFYTMEEYTAKDMESGYAWEILDSDLKSVIGFVDPGLNPNPQTNWLAMVNTAPNIYEQNLTPVQYKGSIYYQVNKAIPPHRELLTYYGDDYTSTIGITQDIYNPRIMGFKCPSCNISFSKNEYLSIHFERVHKVLESTTSHQVKSKRHKKLEFKDTTTDSGLNLIPTYHQESHSNIKEYFCELYLGMNYG
ncbi:PRDM7_9 [Lepeophtheirus salmonis]|uniref:PRDM7_9 n=1 Tax=Lepeophtheirus salmonis TaxID=72036 RepID=A0A7R8CTV0_LEPSM|nr:PRDM7_9 [Lepeophtheirus salmonis]CAF2927577.1 PRDM7_9 [Lepeophtheirus salmonis]